MPPSAQVQMQNDDLRARGREIASEIAKESYMVGIAAVVGASMISGLAGVYIEKILKRGGQHSVSLWIRNIQLASNTHIH